jgi:hypothetical protein
MMIDGDFVIDRIQHGIFLSKSIFMKDGQLVVHIYEIRMKPWEGPFQDGRPKRYHQTGHINEQLDRK